jgi:hypothetical protein
MGFCGDLNVMVKHFVKVHSTFFPSQLQLPLKYEASA